VQQMLINAPEEMKQGISHQVSGLVAAAAPPAAMIEGMQKMGFSITHVYGLTETYGPATVCAKHPEWGRLPLAEQAGLNARQGVRYHVEEGLSVMDPQTMRPVPADGETMGEIMLRGHLAGFKAPRAVVFGELPKTSTGKIQKFLLREKARSTSAIDTGVPLRKPESRSCCAMSATPSAR